MFLPKGTKAFVITVSDTRTEEDDSSGDHIVNALEDKGVSVISKVIIPDDESLISSAITERLNEADVILITGGTGVSSRDVTVETIKFDKVLPGFGELFRYLSYKEIGSSAIMSRATLGIKDNVPVFCLPGSLNAVKLAMDKLVLPEIGHLLGELRR